MCFGYNQPIDWTTNLLQRTEPRKDQVSSYCELDRQDQSEGDAAAVGAVCSVHPESEIFSVI